MLSSEEGEVFSDRDNGVGENWTYPMEINFKTET